MIPFFGMGTDQLAESAEGTPGTGTNEEMLGDDGTRKLKLVYCMTYFSAVYY